MASQVSVVSGTSSYERKSTRALDVLKGIAMCCYVLCPPIPSVITRKLAFHPPKKGNYSVIVEDEPDEKISHAEKLEGKRFYIVPRRMTSCSSSDYEDITQSVQSFLLRTELGNFLIAVRATCTNQKREGNLKNLVVIFAQPNASDLGEYLQPLLFSIPMMALRFGVDVYAFDYSGYGLSSGKPSEKNIYADIRAVYDYVRLKRPDKKIVLIGYSLGTAAAADLAASDPDALAGVVLVAPFASGMRLFTAQPGCEDSNKLDRFITIDKVSKIKVPVLVCHGYRDDAIPYQHGVVVSRRARRAVPPLFLPEADHMSIFNGQYLDTFIRIRTFLAEETDLCVIRSIQSRSTASEESSS